MNHNPIGWIEIPVSDIERAQAFYESLLNITMTPAQIEGYEMRWFPMVDGAIGAAGALVKGQGYTPGPHGSVAYFTCIDIEDALARAEEKGSRIILPLKDIGEWGEIAWLSDSEGNTIALHRTKNYKSRS